MPVYTPLVNETPLVRSKATSPEALMHGTPKKSVALSAIFVNVYCALADAIGTNIARHAVPTIRTQLIVLPPTYSRP